MRGAARGLSRPGDPRQPRGRARASATMRRRKSGRKAPPSATPRAAKSAYLTANTPQSQPFVCSGMSCAEAGSGLARACGLHPAGRTAPGAGTARLGEDVLPLRGVQQRLRRARVRSVRVFRGRPDTPRGRAWVGRLSLDSSWAHLAKQLCAHHSQSARQCRPGCGPGGGRRTRQVRSSPPHRVQVADSRVHKINHRQHPMHSLRPAQPLGRWLPAPRAQPGARLVDRHAHQVAVQHAVASQLLGRRPAAQQRAEGGGCSGRAARRRQALRPGGGGGARRAGGRCRRRTRPRPCTACCRRTC